MDISNKTKLYQANMLKLYHDRETENETDLSVANGEQDMPSVDDDALLKLGTHLQKENVNDVRLEPELSATQINELKASLD